MKLSIFVGLLCCFSIFNAIHAKASFSQNDEESNSVDSTGGRKIRDVFDVLGKSWDCASNGGCKDGKCWTKCGIAQMNWCYTTKGTSMDGNTVGCSNDNECNNCWNCAESCLLNW